jgi:hypothetical protein
MYQLLRKQQEHWISSKGLSQATAEVRLQLIEDTLKTANCTTEVAYVESAKNPADSLTRFPDYINAIMKKIAIPSDIIATISADSWRNHYSVIGNKLVIEPGKIFRGGT